ncbi:MAG: hypothetical protein K6U03_07430, partial [Firmicutes bacterium]|nr:hypothetical protein [Bacillota bacterium]
ACKFMSFLCSKPPEGADTVHTSRIQVGLRDYDAETGRWTCKDPIMFSSQNTNFYSYTFNDPQNFIDPTGEIHWLAAATGGFIYGLGSTLFSDILLQKRSSWQDYISNAFGGAVGGIVATTGNVWAASFANSIAANSMKKILCGEKLTWSDVGTIATETILGGLAGKASSALIPRGPGREPTKSGVL